MAVTPTLFMHYTRSLSDARRLRLVAALLCLKYFATIAGVALLIASLAIRNLQLTALACGLLGASLLLLIIHGILSVRAKCPLCISPVLARRSCVKHRHAKSLFGSHRLLVAQSILLQNRFRCPYCNESTTLELRDTVQISPAKRGGHPVVVAARR